MTGSTASDHFFRMKEWDSQFFQRVLYSGEVNLELNAIDWTRLRDELNDLRRNNVWLVEARVRSSSFDNVRNLEDEGFRLVDSRLEFSTLTQLEGQTPTIPVGHMRWFRESDWEALERLTHNQFAGNPAFKSRYNNRRYFSEDESHRYYMQWYRWVLENQHPLFCVWEVDEKLAGFYSILRQPDDGKIPRYKVALAAVEPVFRSYGAQNLMQFWIFQNAPDEEWYTINSPALTNLSGLKNNIRAAKHLAYVETYFYLELT